MYRALVILCRYGLLDQAVSMPARSIVEQHARKSMPPGRATDLHRRLIAAIAAWLLVLQAFVSGLVSTQAVAITAPDLFGLAVICHGSGNADPDGDTAPDPINAQHLCCFACLAGAPSATLPDQAGLPRFEFHESKSSAVHAAIVQFVGREVRAGQSQAPPRRG